VYEGFLKETSMIRLNSRNVIGFVGSAIMTLGSFALLHTTLSDNEIVRPVQLHSATIDGWQLAQDTNIVVVRAPRA
jgi:hypothetical protein